MSNLKPTRTISKTREPPPSLFLHPSPAASHVSLPGTLAASAALPSTASAAIHGQNIAAQRTASLLNARGTINRPTLLTADSGRTADRTDALWAEMQATLEEVELSASGGTRVFGPDHDGKLGELRNAQIALAQAWARSEADDGIETTATTAVAAAAAAAAAAAKNNDVPNLKGALGEIGIAATAGTGLGRTISASTGKGGPETSVGGKSTVGSGTGPGSSARGGERLGAKLEEETERDILLARIRREANDRYFGKVDQGVRDVVEKLEDVAVAMRAIEEETRNLWGDANIPGAAKA
ncbi:hypothetical protein F4779DRAFT_136827 [Xylariaceae sp. FL0662B]|nr:hypothetical protein F4779DRAFT_136827 [Xylariaceae sp. FL0662B]